MVSKGAFENGYDDYKVDVSPKILNDMKDAVSEIFLAKLLKFKSEKLNILHTDLAADIDYDDTVYTGSCGLALYYFMSAIKNVELNYNMLKNALNYINLDNLKGKRISFLCGDAGPLALATVIAYKLGPRRPESLPEYKKLAQRLLTLGSRLNESPDEILYGKAGYLYALLFVNKHISGEDTIPQNDIEKVIQAIIKSGKQFSNRIKSDSPLLWHWHDKIYFGAAHGMAGILYMLLQARVYVSVMDLRLFIRPTLDWLLAQQFASGNFPSSAGSNAGDRLVQWCHGAPGFVPLYLQAYQVFEDEKYLRVARECGDVVWQRGLTTKGYSLCHGVSGNAYAFLQLYQATKNPGYLYRACCFMEWCAIERPGTELHHPDRPASLFEGLIGRLYLIEDIIQPLSAKFPGLTV